MLSPEKKYLEGIQQDPLGANLVDRVFQADEQGREIVFPGFFDFLAVHVNVIHKQLLRFDHRRHVVPQRGQVNGDGIGRFLEGHADARFAVVQHPAHEEFHAHERLAGTRSARHQGAAPLRQTAMRDLVQPRNAAGGLA